MKNAPSLSESFFSGYYANVDELSDDNLVDVVIQLRKRNKCIEMENLVFENFLQRNDPRCLAGMQQILEQASKILCQMRRASLSMQSQLNVSPSRRSVNSLESTYSKKTNMSKVSYDKTKHINLKTKIDLAIKEKEHINRNLLKFQKQAQTLKNNITAQMEEMMTRMKETNDSTRVFEEIIIKTAVDPLTQKVPAEKFIKYMEDWLKSTDGTIEKLRLKINTIRLRNIFLNKQIRTKIELSENLFPVDIDELMIKSKEYIKITKQKSEDMQQLKKDLGKVNLQLTKEKEALQSKLDELNRYKNNNKKANKKITEARLAISKAEKEIQVTDKDLHRIKDLMNNYTVPSALEYITLKDKRLALQKQIKIWTSKNEVQKITLNFNISKMKKLTGQKIVHESWFMFTPEKEMHYVEDEI